MPKVSVIIPVYNSEKYLTKCLESVINQTLSDIEFICIDNGSTDNSSEILKDFAQADKRIKIIKFKNNIGASKARNIGIDNAKGKYISFIDSDDFIALDFLEKLYKKAKENNADAVKGNIYNYYVDTKKTELTDFYNMNDKIRRNKAYFYYGFTSAIYKKRFLDKHNIRFPENISYFEDPFFSINACINYKKLCFDDSAEYYYSQYNQNSVSNHATIGNFEDFKNVGLKIIDILNKTKISQKSYNIVFDFLYNFAISNYNNSLLDDSIRVYLFDIIMNFLFICKYPKYISEEIKAQMKYFVRKDKYYEELYKNYKKYDYLNKKSNKIKILVSYIKPSFLFKTDILTPIHLGRVIEKSKSKDGIATDDDIKWLHKNCIGDDDFKGNISHLNRRIGFFTGTYWAWKNYDKLGNPKYFGSMGYRKLLFPNALENLSEYDFILPEKTMFKETLKSQFVHCHGKNYYDIMIDSIKSVFPDETKDVINYFSRKSGYFAEMYIMKKNIFFEYCEWIFKIIDYLIKKYPDFINTEIGVNRIDFLLSKFTGIDKFRINGMKLNKNELRDIAFIIERLSGYYVYKLTQNKKLKYKEALLFEPEVLSITAIEYKKIMLEQMRKNVKSTINRSI